MRRGLQPYRHYQSARVGWLGTIPDHWDQRRGKFLFREVDERSKTGGEELLSVSHKTGVTPRSEKNVTMFRAESYVGHKLARPGDVVVNTMWAWMSALGVARNIGVVSPAYGVYRPLDSDYVPEYLDLLLRIPQLRHEYVCRSTGIRSSRLRLYPDQFLDIVMPIPGFDEQRQIVAFIRYKDQQIRQLIRAKRRLIELLNEQKQAITHQAVTKGLDAAVPMKPSGIEWLGEVPAHWELSKLKHLAHFDNGLAFKPADWKSEGIPIIRIQNLNGNPNYNYTDRLDLPPDMLIGKGDILFSWSGNVGTSFGPYIWEHDFTGYLNQHIFKVTNYHQSKSYLYFLLLAVTRHVEEQTHGIIGLVHITKPELGRVVVPIAPPGEQRQIEEHLEKRCLTWKIHEELAGADQAVEIV